MANRQWALVRFRDGGAWTRLPSVDARAADPALYEVLWEGDPMSVADPSPVPPDPAAPPDVSFVEDTPDE